MTSVMTGWTSGFIQRFAGTWLLGFAVALPTSLAITPLIKRLVKLVVIFFLQQILRLNLTLGHFFVFDPGTADPARVGYKMEGHRFGVAKSED